VTVASEEQGLNGSRQLAEWLHEKGYKVVAGMTDDIVGNVVAEDGYVDSTSMRIFAADPDNSPSRELGRYVWALDRVYMPNFDVLPVWRLDRIGREIEAKLERLVTGSRDDPPAYLATLGLEGRLGTGEETPAAPSSPTGAPAANT